LRSGQRRGGGASGRKYIPAGNGHRLSSFTNAVVPLKGC
jgi:hypothetical protein